MISQVFSQHRTPPGRESGKLISKTANKHPQLFFTNAHTLVLTPRHSIYQFITAYRVGPSVKQIVRLYCLRGKPFGLFFLKASPGINLISGFFEFVFFPGGDLRPQCTVVLGPKISPTEVQLGNLQRTCKTIVIDPSVYNGDRKFIFLDAVS